MNYYDQWKVASLRESKRVQTILDLLKQGEQTVTSCWIATRDHQPNVSQALIVLESFGVVKSRREGKFVYYSIDNLNNLETEYSLEVLQKLKQDLNMKILQFIQQGETNVSSIYRTLKLEQSVVSQKLKQFRDLGIVSVRRDGRTKFYSLNIEI